jgi:uncharacterized membrane protein
MNVNEGEEIKKEFQLERVILFSDAVFAIIITIMVLEMKMPEGLRHANAEKVKEAFMELLPKFGGYVISFLIVGVFWSKHLKIFSFIKDYTNQLIALNLLFLFSISLFPFAVSLMTETLGPHSLYGLAVYFGIVMFCSLTQTLLVHYLIINANELCIMPADIRKNLQWKSQRFTYIAVPAFYALIIAAIVLDLNVNVITTISAVWAITLAVIRKKYYPAAKVEDGPILARLFRSRRRLKEAADQQ